MIAPFTTILATLFIALTTITGTLAYYPQGFITAPANGTAVAPGAPFNFTYNVRADYCLSSFNYTVYLFTGTPSPNSLFLGPDNEFATGYHLGRFSGENYPANPYPKNPAPQQLVMPDFSKSPGGFGAGATASNKTVYLTVVEEWASCSGALGVHFSVTYNNLVYNATRK